MRKRSLKKLPLNRFSVADLSKRASIKGGVTSVFCPSENEDCDDPTAINCLSEQATCRC